MRKCNIKKVVVFMLAMVTCCSFLGCQDKGGDDVSVSESAGSSAATNGLTISESALTIKVGETKTLTLGGAEGEVVWSSMDETIATVVNGAVSGVKIGTTMIVAAVNGETVFCAVTVEDSLLGVPNLEIISKSKNIYSELDYTLKAQLKVGATEVEGVTYQWQSSDTTVATVDNGVVSTLKAGKVTITVSCTYEGKTLSDSVELSISDIATMQLDTKILMGNIGAQYSLALSGEKFDKTSNSLVEIPMDEYTITSSDAQVVDFNKATGVVEIKGEGIAELTVSYGTMSDVCKVYGISTSTATVLTTKEQFEALNGKDVSGTFILGNDIDFGGVTGVDKADNYRDGVASVFQGFNSFDGIFYGNGYTLKNFCLQARVWNDADISNGNKTGKEDGVSFFGAVSADSWIGNVEMLNFNIRPGYHSGVPCNNATASFLSRNFAGTLENVVMQCTAYGSNYHYDDTKGWIMGEMGLLFYSTEATAVIKDVMMETQISSRGTQRAVSAMGDFECINLLLVGSDQENICGAAGYGTKQTNVWSAPHATLAETMEQMVNGNGGAGLMATGGYSKSVWDYASISGANLPELIDGCDVATILELL